MRSTCDNVANMSKMIQIRNVPDELHREVKVRAARAGMSLSEYLLREVRRVTEEPPVEDILARIAARERIHLSESPAAIIRAQREAR